MSVSENGFEVPDHPGTWGELSVYGAVDGRLTPGDRDWYRVYLEAGRIYTFVMAGRDDPALSNDHPYDSQLMLFDAAGKWLARGSEDGAASPDDSQLVFRAQYTGVYYVQAAGLVQTAGSTGSYRLELTTTGQSSDVTESLATASRLVMNQAKVGAIDLPSDVDLHQVDLQGGVNYAITLPSTTLPQPRLNLYGPQGQDLGQLLPGVAFAVAGSGTHFVGVSGQERGDTGQYELVWTRPGATVSIGANSGVQATAGEAAGSMQFFVTLSNPQGQAVSVRVRSREDVTAKAGSDFQTVDAVVTFAPGETVKRLDVPITNDRLAEPSENFVLELSDPLGAAIGNRLAYGYIFDNDFVRPTQGGKPLFDPLTTYQWYLYPEFGANVTPVWPEYSGKGVRVAVYDQGIDPTHDDLAPNLRTDLGRMAETLNPGGAPILNTDNHGTAVAGVIAAARNNIGITGVAFDAELVSLYSSLGGNPSENVVEGQRNAFRYAQQADILNDSWGYAPKLAWQTLDRPWAFYDNFRSLLFYESGAALRQLAELGRDGLGTIVVQSAGNSFSVGDDTNLHSYQNSRYIITVAATDYDGHVTEYSSPGASVLVSAPGGGSDGNLSDIYTTDRMGEFGYSLSNYHSIAGTSFSAPIVSGVVALMLEANPGLGYRDVQEILAYSARRVSTEYNTWSYNGAKNWNGGGLHYDSITHDLGFGMVDAHAAVRLAENWSRTPETSANDIELFTSVFKPTAIPDGSIVGVTQSIRENRDIDVERVEVTVDILHTYIGDLGLLLTSPSGTQSWLMFRAGVNELLPFGTEQDQIDFTFSTVLSMGESSVGDWKLTVYDFATSDAGELRSWSLNLIGNAASADDVYIFTNEFSSTLQSDPGRSLLRDTGGYDRLNASAVTSSSAIDLRPGSKSTMAGAQLTIAGDAWIEDAIAGDGNDQLTGNSLANTLKGMRGNDVLYGLGGADRLIGGVGSDILDGGDGLDIAQFDSPRAGYTLSRLTNDWRIGAKSSTGDTGQDTLRAVERLHFSDTRVALDIDGAAGSVMKIIGGVLGPSFLSDRALIALGLELMDNGTSYEALIGLALGTDMFLQLAGSPSDADFVRLIYRNVVGQAPDAGSVQYYVGLLNSGEFDRTSLALFACETELNQSNVDLVGLARTGLDFGPEG